MELIKGLEPMNDDQFADMSAHSMDFKGHVGRVAMPSAHQHVPRPSMASEREAVGMVSQREAVASRRGQRPGNAFPAGSRPANFPSQGSDSAKSSHFSFRGAVNTAAAAKRFTSAAQPFGHASRSVSPTQSGGNGLNSSLGMLKVNRLQHHMEQNLRRSTSGPKGQDYDMPAAHADRDPPQKQWGSGPQLRQGGQATAQPSQQAAGRSLTAALAQQRQLRPPPGRPAAKTPEGGATPKKANRPKSAAALLMEGLKNRMYVE